MTRFSEELRDLEAALETAASTAGDHFGSRLMLESLERRRNDLLASAAGVLELHLEAATDNTTGAEISLVSRVLDSMQESLASIAQVLAGEPTTRGLIPAAIKDAVALRIAGATPGSLHLKLVAAGQAPAESDQQLVLAEDEHTRDDAPVPLIDESVNQLISLLNTDDDRDSLLHGVAYVGPRAALHVQHLARALEESGASASFSWSSQHSSNAAAVSSQAARRLYAVLSETKEERREIIYTGRIVGGSLVRRTFELELDGDESTVIGGRVVDTALNDLARLFGQACTAHIEVREAHHSSGETSESHTLTQLSN